MTTTISVIGTIATNPKLISPAAGVQLCSFRLASDERRYDREQQAWVGGETNWFGVVCFRGLAPNAYASFSKGERVVVIGKVRVRNWTKDDRKGTSIEIEAEAIGHDVRWGISRFEKRSGSGSSAQRQLDSAPSGNEFREPDDPPQSSDQPFEPSSEPSSEPSFESIQEAPEPAAQSDGFTPSLAAAA